MTKGPHAGKFSVKYKDDPNWWTHSLLREGYGKDKKYKDDPNWWTHSLLREGYGKDKHWVLMGLPSRDFA